MDHLDAPNNGGPSPESWPLALPSSVRPLPRPIAPGLEPEEPAGEARRPAIWGTMLRGLRRYWWQAALIWIIGSAALMAGIHARVKPSYEVYAEVEILPPLPSVYGTSPVQQGRSEDPFESQIRLMTSHNVLSAAANDERLKDLPRIRQSPDAEVELRQMLRPMHIPRTNLIHVQMSAEDSAEASQIVNVVVDQYVKASELKSREQAEQRKRELEDHREKLELEVKVNREKLKSLAGRDGLDGPDALLGDGEARVRSPEELRLNEVTLEEYKELNKELIGLEDRIWMVEGELSRLRAEQASEAARGEGSDPDREGRVAAALRNDQELTALRRALEEAADAYRNAAARTRKAGDPARVQAQQRYEGLRQRYQEVAQAREADVRARLDQEWQSRDRGAGTLDGAIRQAELELTRLETQRDRFAERLDDLRVRARGDRLDALDQEFARVDFNIAQEKLRKVDAMLDQLRFEIDQNTDHVTVNSYARNVKHAASDKRSKYMALAPVGMLFVVVGLTTLLEGRAARVANPDDLPGRVRVGVIGVVPPLPGGRSLLGRNSPARLQRQVEEFVQSLDHLRVLLCSSTLPGAAPGTGAEGRRVVLITSACGSEGKTTLAAQLAGRCANAGLSTLLVDADLRRPRLAELLEVPDGLGLSDVLAGEAEPEAAMVVIGSAGGFHLLPAGSPGHDPSRLLEGDRLGRLMGQLRATFDVVIIDAPPVLAVPDALLLGRWVDGAVLAVRHDASRFPLVERANRRLAAIGIPVLGAVVNGARSPDVAYGSYGQNYSYSYAQNSGGA